MCIRTFSAASFITEENENNSDYRELNKNKLRNTHTKEFQSFPKNEINIIINTKICLDYYRIKDCKTISM